MRSPFFTLFSLACLTITAEGWAQTPAASPPPDGAPPPSPASVDPSAPPTAAPPPPVFARPSFAPMPFEEKAFVPYEPYDPTRGRDLRRPPRQMSAVDGKGLPEGYHEEKRLQRAPFITGGPLFFVGYAAAIAGGVLGSNQSARPDRWAWMYVPIIGPFVTLDRARPTFDNDADAVLVGITGVMQLTGLLVFAGGFVLPKRTLWVMDEDEKRLWDEREDEWKRERRRRSDRRRGSHAPGAVASSLFVSPFALRQGGGIGVIGVW